MDLKKLIKLQNAIIRAHQKIKDVESNNDTQTKEFQNEINILTKTLEQLTNELNSYTKKEDADKQNIELKRLKSTLDELNESVDRKISSIQLKHGRDGLNGKDGRPGKDGRDGKDGKPGKDGKSGRDGKDGCNGLSAYEIAVKQGFEGTEKEWIDHITNNGGKNYSGQIAAIRGKLNELENKGGLGEDVLTKSDILQTIEECEQCTGESVPAAGLLARTYNAIPKTVSQLENDEGFIKQDEIPETYSKDEIDAMANQLMGSMPEIIPLEEYNPEEQYAGNQITNANTMNYVIGMVGEAFDGMGQYVEEVRTELLENTLTVQYTLNPQDMTMTFISHYSSDIIQAFNEGKKVAFSGYVLGLNVYVTSELQLVDNQYVFTYPLLKVNLGQGEKTYLFKIQVSSNSTSVEMNEIGGASGTDDNIFLVEYLLNLTNKQITYVSKTQQEIIDAHNKGKKVMFRGSVVEANAILSSELNTIDSGIPYTYPFLRTDLGEGIYNYFFRISVYREYGNVEPYALVDINKLNQTVETINTTISNVAMSRPTTDVVQNMVNFFVNEAIRGYQNRLLPTDVSEGATVKYIDGQWVAVEENIFTVEYQINPQTMEITEISHYSNDIVQAYNDGKKVTFRGYVLGLGVYVNSELEMVDGNYALTFPLIRGDLGMGTMNYLFDVLVMTGSTRVTVHVLQELT